MGDESFTSSLQKLIYMKRLSYTHTEKSKNSIIRHQLSMKVYGRNLSHTSVLLGCLENSCTVDWSDYCNFVTSINRYFILNFMEDVISKEDIIHP